MSAYKCGNGNPYAVVLPTPRAPKNPEILPQEDEYFGRAATFLQRIRKRFPNFIPVSEEEIFYRARSLGMTEEE